VVDTCPTSRSGGNRNIVAFKASHYTRGKDGAPSELAPPLSADADKGDQDTLIAIPILESGARTGKSTDDPRAGSGIGENGDPMFTLQSEMMAVRRLTPLECTRLQGFKDDFFDHVLYRGKPPADGPIYKALGNSMAVPVIAWIGKRIAQVDAILSTLPTPTRRQPTG
jgi:DNA (cytosine-5)-methyltransferase 1